LSKTTDISKHNMEDHGEGEA